MPVAKIEKIETGRYRLSRGGRSVILTRRSYDKQYVISGPGPRQSFKTLTAAQEAYAEWVDAIPKRPPPPPIMTRLPPPPPLTRHAPAPRAETDPATADNEIVADHPWVTDFLDERLMRRGDHAKGEHPASWYLTPLGALDEVFRWMVDTIPAHAMMEYPWCRVIKVIRREHPEARALVDWERNQQ